MTRGMGFGLGGGEVCSVVGCPGVSWGSEWAEGVRGKLYFGVSGIPFRFLGGLAVGFG